MAPIDRETFRRLLRPLCAMYRVGFDVAQWTVYHDALRDISPPLLEAAVVLASQSTATFMPRPGELRAYAEQARVARLAERPWKPCASCAPLGGFVEVDDEGVRRLARCRCRAAHLQRLEAEGLPCTPLIGAVHQERDDAAAWAELPASQDESRQ